jgi:hypothetical protein
MDTDQKKIKKINPCTSESIRGSNSAFGRDNSVGAVKDSTRDGCVIDLGVESETDRHLAGFSSFGYGQVGLLISVVVDLGVGSQ